MSFIGIHTTTVAPARPGSAAEAARPAAAPRPPPWPCSNATMQQPLSSEAGATGGTALWGAYACGQWHWAQPRGEAPQRHACLQTGTAHLALPRAWWVSTAVRLAEEKRPGACAALPAVTGTCQAGLAAFGQRGGRRQPQGQPQEYGVPPQAACRPMAICAGCIRLFRRRDLLRWAGAGLIVLAQMTSGPHQRLFQRLCLRAAALLLLLVASCRGTEFQEGDFVPSARRAQFHGVSALEAPARPAASCVHSLQTSSCFCWRSCSDF